jgi:lysophospholipase L1-like esterase
MTTPASTVLQTGQTLLFIGDSITDGDRRDPAFAPLGRGYVRLLHDLLVLREPAKRITVINRGIGGNTADDLRSRWHEDALLHRPDVLVVKIGINDLNQYLCQPDKPHVSPEAFSKIHDDLLARARAALPDARIVVLSPFLLSTDADADSYRARVLRTLPAYIEPARANAARHAARFVDLHALFQDRLRLRHPDVYCPEPVHPNATGHLVIADAVYAALTA